MGNVKERCLKNEIAVDEHVGRVAYGLNLSSTNFAMSPPYFEFEHTNDPVQAIETKRKIENWLKSKLNDSEIFNSEALHLVLMMFAGLYYHINVSKKTYYIPHLSSKKFLKMF